MILLKFVNDAVFQVLEIFINDLCHLLHIFAIIFKVAAQASQFPSVKQ